MKIGFVNCWVMPGGVLNVVEDLLLKLLKQEGPDSEIRIFTLISDRDFLEVPIPGREGEFYRVPVVQTLPGWINRIFLYCTKKKIFLLSALFDYRNLMFFYPWLMKLLSYKIKRWKPDKIQISSFALAKNIEKIPWVPTLLYLHSPMQYIWSHYEEYNEKLPGWKRALFNFITPLLRKWDKKYRDFDEVRVNSIYTQQLAKELYGMESIVDYPKVSDVYYYAGISSKPAPYYVFVGRLVRLVRETDRIIRLFNELKLPLIVIGSGPDEDYLKSIAGDTIIFTGRSPEGMVDIIKDAKGLINLTKESFGIGTVEALLMGVPVFGFAEGASVELVDEVSWVLVAKKDQEILLEGFAKFSAQKWDRKLISENIRKKLN